MSSELISKQINAYIPAIKCGTLKFFGEWFGRPYDNYHKIIGSNFQDNNLIIHFDNGESLTIWQPEGFCIGDNLFSIDKAKCIRWEWFYYGKPQTTDNLRIILYKLDDYDVGTMSDRNVDLRLANNTYLAVEII